MGLSLVLICQVSTGSGRCLLAGSKCKVKGRVRE